MNGERAAGILLHPTSLPGRFGIGDFGPDAERFLEWAQSAGQRLWQVLPLHPAPYGSPYGSSSAFAGNPLLISPDRLCEEGFLSQSALEDAPALLRDRVDFTAAREWKEQFLRASWEESRATPRVVEELESFRGAPEQAAWLADWSLFAAIGQMRWGGWTLWPEDLRRRQPEALAAARRELAQEIAYQDYVQFLFFRQWGRVKAQANRRGLAILGDVPIYVAHDSADVWARQELFLLDAGGRPEVVAGVPPDAFSETGQLWGYPMYRWDEMEKDGFSWWTARVRMALTAADAVRIDHFRGFAAGWSVSATETSAINGRWTPGPGAKLFEALRRALGEVPLVAEDLGVITEDVRALLAALGIPGMRVLQFGFSEDDSEHLPHRHVADSVVYTGTHDNDTTRGWFAALGGRERRRVLEYVGGDGSDIAGDFIRAAYTSVAGLAVVPLQDVLGLGSEARMNTPGRA
ncbi:MAG TPA: 4-alpha-glucanotransferase, partial [Thermoanaerobaculia bacterium]